MGHSSAHNHNTGHTNVQRQQSLKITLTICFKIIIKTAQWEAFSVSWSRCDDRGTQYTTKSEIRTLGKWPVKNLIDISRLTNWIGWKKWKCWTSHESTSFIDAEKYSSLLLWLRINGKKSADSLWARLTETTYKWRCETYIHVRPTRHNSCRQ